MISVIFVILQGISLDEAAFLATFLYFLCYLGKGKNVPCTFYSNHIHSGGECLDFSVLGLCFGPLGTLSLSKSFCSHSKFLEQTLEIPLLRQRIVVLKEWAREHSASGMPVQKCLERFQQAQWHLTEFKTVQRDSSKHISSFLVQKSLFLRPSLLYQIFYC